MKLLLLICLLACIPSGSLLAHPAGFSGMRLTVEAERVRVALTVHTRDMDDWFPPGKYPDYVGDITREMENTVDEIVELQIQERPQAIESVRAFELELQLGLKVAVTAVEAGSLPRSDAKGERFIDQREDPTR